ncbi:MAG: LytTR family transcriptional regulator [Bacteroidia bacterium]|nr:LytTR family transcriptional regulator [Bacteroidia bacterium]
MKTLNTQFEGTVANFGDSLMFRANYQSVVVPTEDILYIQALADYVIIKTAQAKHITLATMKDMANLLQGRGFIRTHRSYIVNIDHIQKFKGSTVVLDNESSKIAIPVGRAFKKEFRQSMAA